MLSGWKMLATHCPICNSALLQKELKVQCASCNMPVMTQEQYDSRGDNATGSNSNIDIDVSPLSQSIARSRKEHEEGQRRNDQGHCALELIEEQEENEAENQDGDEYHGGIDLGRTSENNDLPQTQSKHEYDGYYSDNDNIGETNSLEAEKKIYDLNNKKRDLTSSKLGKKIRQ